ncbi:MAG: type II toxin-antitoxin system HicA family toxin [Armatimonadetes bacterium]|nr:type II toxin-antitoxin system HicA family toxin [Armatimonadota bacterium]
MQGRERRGWVLLRISSSHHVYAKAGQRYRVVIPVHAGQPLKRGIQAKLMKLAGVLDDDL